MNSGVGGKGINFFWPTCWKSLPKTCAAWTFFWDASLSGSPVASERMGETGTEMKIPIYWTGMEWYC